MRKARNPRSELIERFHGEYVENVEQLKEQGALEGPENALETCEAYLRIGWNASAIEHIEQFEERTGIDFDELVAGTQSRHLADPRGN